MESNKPILGLTGESELSLRHFVPSALTQAKDNIRVLHVTPWYPGEARQTDALFIARHIQSLQPFVDQTVLHISVSMENAEDRYLEQPGLVFIEKSVLLRSWRMVEWQFYRALKKQLKKLNARENFTHVNFHIAYPAMMYFKKLERWLPEKKLITEHWSAYHFNFNSPEKPRRLSKMFQHPVRILAVSKALALDITSFSEAHPDIVVLPNVVDTTVFSFKNQMRQAHFFSAAMWKFPKKPLEILEMCKQRKESGSPVYLRIAGLGVYEKEIVDFIKINKLEEVVTWLGQLNAEEIASELNHARALLLPTGYETFSTIIAEAFCCGCPVIASNVGAITEHITAETGVAVNSDWMQSMKEFESMEFNHALISERARNIYNMEFIGRKYYDVLKGIE